MAAGADGRFFRPGLTGLRALAALWVAAFHLNGLAGPREIVFLGLELHPLITVGWVGVQVFFVLSGFLLTTHLAQAAAALGVGQALPRYAAARVRRVFPAYWAQILVLIAVHRVATGAMPPWIGHVPLHVPMLQNLSEAASHAINGVYWTLPIELAFYLVLPLLVRLLLRIEARRRARWLALAGVYAAALGASVGWRLAVYALHPEAGSSTLFWAMNQLPGTIDEFVLGSALAMALRWAHADGLLPGPEARGRVSNLLALAGLAGTVWLMYALDAVHETFWQGHPLLFTWHSAACACIALLVAGIAISGPVTRLLFENRLAVFLGTVSYSIYLWHFPVGQAVKAGLFAPGPVPLLPYFAVAGGLVLVVSALSYAAVERPFLKPPPRP